MRRRPAGSSSRRYLGAAFHVFFNPTFRYVREIVGPSDAMLEFETEIDGVHDQRRRPHPMERRRPDRRLQGHAQAAEGDQPHPPAHGGDASGRSVNAPPLPVFRALTRADLPMLHGWLQRPHVAEWWPAPTTLAELEDDYFSAAAAASSTRACIAALDGEPLGFIQSYVALGSGDGWWEDETDPGVRGIDQFLADGSRLGQGLGSAMVDAFARRLFADPAVTKIQTDPSPDNARAIRCYRRAGFVDRGSIVTPDGPALLMIRGRP